MTLYEISSEMLKLINQETGEIEDIEAFDALQMEKNEKVENVGLWVKNLTAEVKALREEEKNLAERRHAAERKIERLEKYIVYANGYEKFSTPRVSISFRKSSSVEVGDDFLPWAMANAEDLLTYSAPTVNKTAIKQAINEGREVVGAAIVENKSISVK